MKNIVSSVRTRALQPVAINRKRKLPLAIQQFPKQKMLHLMILPGLVTVIVFAYFPLYGIIIAFKNFNVFDGIMGSPWARNGGLEHFIDFFNFPSTKIVIRNTIVIALLKLAFLSFPPVILAILINEVQALTFKKITQTISYLPHFISWVVIGGIIYNFLSPSFGPVNDILKRLGLIKESIDFLSSKTFFWPLIVLSDMWKEVGWGSIIYLAVIASIDPNLYEAIDIDGGGRWVKVRHATWPYLKGTFMILFILSCGSIMSGMGATFNQVYVLGNITNRGVSDILDTYTLRVGLEGGSYSLATAVGLFKSLINLALLVSANKLSKMLTEKSLF